MTVDEHGSMIFVRTFGHLSPVRSDWAMTRSRLSDQALVKARAFAVAAAWKVVAQPAKAALSVSRA